MVDSLIIKTSLYLHSFGPSHPSKTTHKLLVTESKSLFKHYTLNVMNCFRFTATDMNRTALSPTLVYVSRGESTQAVPK